MASVEEAQEILRTLGLPPAQQNQMSGYTLLALCVLGPNDPWVSATRTARTVTKGVMDYVRDTFAKEYAPNTRETFRRQVLHQFVQARIADYNPFEPNLPTNSPRAHYALTEDALAVIRTYGTSEWAKASAHFVASVGALAEIYAKKRNMERIPVRLPDGKELRLSPGKHNQVQRAIVEDFAPRFAPGSQVLYLGDTENKDLHRDDSGFASLGVTLTEHDKLPDVVLYDRNRNWLFLIEAVTSHGPVSPKRVFEIEKMLSKCPAGPVYVSAFPNFAEFKRWIAEIAWETEVWIAEMPDHMIHYNGDRFLGPRS
ncbi:restriction endonuclease [Microvirga makkahensis]|uniref:Restriction endonuclease n=1 Tax=Microvirga makkahensis TaxID=1128670 RepID=A0A7X3MQ70_9HYPH|nr:restriction endonuclease [Microvirga makkahensis]